MKHVSNNASTRSSCIRNVIDLSFVYGCNKSFEKFIEEFSKLKLPPYVLYKENDIYYLAKEPNSAERREGDFLAKTKERIYSNAALDNMENNEIMQQSAEASSQLSDTSSLNGSPPGTDGGNFFRAKYIVSCVNLND